MHYKKKGVELQTPFSTSRRKVRYLQILIVIQFYKRYTNSDQYRKAARFHFAEKNQNEVANSFLDCEKRGCRMTVICWKKMFLGQLSVSTTPGELR